MLFLLQLHIHIAHFDSSRSNQGIEQSNWLVRKVAQHAGFSSKASSPTRILGEGYYDPGQYKTCSPLHRPPRDWARTYAVFMPTKDPVNDLGVSEFAVVVLLCTVLQHILTRMCICLLRRGCLLV